MRDHLGPIAAALFDPSNRHTRCFGANWRRRPDLNRGWRFCRPLPYHLATAPVGTGDRSLLGMSGRVYRHDRQRRAEAAKEESIITSARSEVADRIYSPRRAAFAASPFTKPAERSRRRSGDVAAR